MSLRHFLPWGIRVAFPGERQLRQSRATQPTQPTVHAWCFSVSIIYMIFNVHTDVNACDCTLGCTDTVGESALKVDTEPERKIPCRTGESYLRQRRSGPMLHQLSRIPTCDCFYTFCQCMASAACIKLNLKQSKIIWLILISVIWFFSLDACPIELTFTWWGCWGLCFWLKPTELAHSFLFCSCVYFYLYGPFNRISFHKFSRQLSAFSLCSSGLNSALLVPHPLSPENSVAQSGSLKIAQLAAHRAAAEVKWGGVLTLFQPVSIS